MKNQANNTPATISLNSNEAIVLAQIYEDGENDISLLTQQLGMPRGRVASLVAGLKHKGLLVIAHDYHGSWVRLSLKGTRLMRYMWPEARLHAV